MFEIKAHVSIEVHIHQHSGDGGHKQILDKLDWLTQKLVELSTSLNPKERRILQGLLDNLKDLATD